MKFVIILAVLSLGIAYQAYSCDAEVKAKLRENGLYGDLWEQPDFDSDKDSFENNKYAITDVTSEEECALECLQTEDCAAYTVQMLCKPEPWSCRLILKAGSNKTFSNLTRAEHFTRRNKPEDEIQGAFYRPDTNAFHVVVGTVLVTYKTLSDLMSGKPIDVARTDSLFPNFDKTVDAVLVRQVVDVQNTSLLVHLISRNKSHNYRLDSNVGPAVEVSVQELDFIGAYGWVDAAIELNQCDHTCPHSHASTTYFLIAGEYIYEAQGDTWLESADGEFYDKDGSSFPVGLNNAMAATRFTPELDNRFFVFEKLQVYYYQLSTAGLSATSQVDLCP